MRRSGVEMGKIGNKIDRAAFAGKILSVETKGAVKRIKCKGCDHSFDATFSTENPDPNNVGYCPVCGGCDFEFVVGSRGRNHNHNGGNRRLGQVISKGLTED